MTESVKAYLALNCVLNGHSILEAFDNDINEAANVLTGGDVKMMQSYHDKLEEARKLPSVVSKHHPTAVAILNTMRLPQYSDYCIAGHMDVPLSALESLVKGKSINNAQKESMIYGLFQNFVEVENASECRVEDGTVYTTYLNTEQLMAVVMDAYLMYTRGVSRKKCTTLLKCKDNLRLENYREFSPKEVCDILSSILSCEINPTDFSKTCLYVEDLLPVYKETGCLMSLTSHNSVTWVMADGTCIDMSPLDLELVGVSKLHDFANVYLNGKEFCKKG